LTWFKRHPLVSFFVLSYAISWPAWELEARGATWASFPGYFGPAIAAITIIMIAQGREALENLLTRILRWRVPIRWYLLSIFVPLSIILSVIPIQFVINQAASFDAQIVLPNLPRLTLLLVGGILIGTLITAGEEIGWRGFSLPELLKNYDPIPASLIVGIFWGFWHLPLIWLFYKDQFNLINALFYALGFIATSVFYTWLYLRTGGCILIACLFHSTYDTVAILTGGLPGKLFSFRTHMMVWIVMAAGLLTLSGQLKNQVTKVHTVSSSPE